MTGRVLTPGQRAQLTKLYVAGARDLESATDVYRERTLNPVVIGKLREFGLADGKVCRSAGGAQRTAYWLTPAGVSAAERLGDAHHG